ncbi:hypothetical protein DSO57_1036457 [Entomophthora muscae]|uniref:Uncharacterized protein n=1 Tax=Entomophthora muscae TaxID=34485 RepID=A0ACC2S1L1_9FUNG|nr:hypothetical protein DSO57_1036457 [Entomophthora muscae]
MDRSRSVNQKSSLKSSIFRESAQNSSEQPTDDLKRNLLNNFSTKDATKDTIVTSLNPSVSKTINDFKTNADKLELNSSISDTSKEPESVENKKSTNLTTEHSKGASKKQKGLRNGRFSGHAGKFNLSKDLPQQEIDTRFPEKFRFRN